MERAGICRNNFGNNPVTRGSVQVSPSYWPYESEEGRSTADDDGADRFIAEIRKMLGERACVRSSFSTADEVLARQWFTASVPLERIGQAILLGCARKYVAWRNNQAVQGSPILTLRYFEAIVDEISKQKLDADYWEFLRFRIQRHEKLWIEKHREEKDLTSETAAEGSTRAKSE